MNIERNVIKWHLINDTDGKFSSLRGWDARLENRYEMWEEEGMYAVFLVVPEQYGDGWGFRKVGWGSIIDCMQFAERNADGIYAQMDADDEDGRDSQYG